MLLVIAVFVVSQEGLEADLKGTAVPYPSAQSAGVFGQLT